MLSEVTHISIPDAAIDKGRFGFLAHGVFALELLTTEQIQNGFIYGTMYVPVERHPVVTEYDYDRRSQTRP